MELIALSTGLISHALISDVLVICSVLALFIAMPLLILRRTRSLKVTLLNADAPCTIVDGIVTGTVVIQNLSDWSNCIRALRVTISDNFYTEIVLDEIDPHRVPKQSELVLDLTCPPFKSTRFGRICTAHIQFKDKFGQVYDIRQAFHNIWPILDQDDLEGLADPVPQRAARFRQSPSIQQAPPEERKPRTWLPFSKEKSRNSML